MNKVPETVKQQLLELLHTPRKIHEISETMVKARTTVALYLRLLLKDDEVVKIIDYEDLKSFFYVKTEHSKSTSNHTG